MAQLKMKFKLTGNVENVVRGQSEMETISTVYVNEYEQTGDSNKTNNNNKKKAGLNPEGDIAYMYGRYIYLYHINVVYVA